MNCPVCADPVLVQRTARGESLPSRGGHRWVVSAPCPCCGVHLFGWTEGETEAPEELVPPEGFLHWRASSRGWAVMTVADVITISLITAISATLVFFAAWAVYRAIQVTSSVLALAVFSVGPAFVLLGLVVFACSLVGPVIAKSRADRSRAYRHPPGGLRLVHEPVTYRG